MLEEGGGAKQNNGFFKTSLEEYILHKGSKIDEQNPGFKLHLKKIRANERYCLPEKNYSIKDDFRYEDADAKRGLHY